MELRSNSTFTWLCGLFGKNGRGSGTLLTVQREIQRGVRSAEKKRTSSSWDQTRYLHGAWSIENFSFWDREDICEFKRRVARWWEISVWECGETGRADQVESCWDRRRIHSECSDTVARHDEQKCRTFYLIIKISKYAKSPNTVLQCLKELKRYQVVIEVLLHHCDLCVGYLNFVLL